MEAREEEPTELNDQHFFIRGRRSKRRVLHNSPISTPSSSSSFSDEEMAIVQAGRNDNEEEEEEEDMANCLILLAQGRSRRAPSVYQCRTCGRCFPTFQALGGHRTSHKKAARGPLCEEGLVNVMKIGGGDGPVRENGGRRKIHECSVCGSGFRSGQALGGHMRRHRLAAGNEAPTAAVVVADRGGVILDLNLPAQEEDRGVGIRGWCGWRSEGR